jgi:predicted phosphate transport protein (TIGR00153 family)
VNVRLALAPRRTEFYGLFAQAGRNAVETARLTERRFREWPDSTTPHEHVKELESKGDGITHELIQLLNTQYVTPFDREDIYELATAVDDVVDHVEHASDLLGLYKIGAPMEQALEQAKVLVAAAEALGAALDELRNPPAAGPHLAELKKLEDAGDRIVRDAIAALFENEDVDPRHIIRWKDIFEALEEATDACETAAHVIGNVVVKNA